MAVNIKHPDSDDTVYLTETPLYGVERAMGIDPTLPTADDTVEFKLYDDDGEFCYGGTLDDDEECENQMAALRYGEADYGATVIKVKRDGGFVQEIA